MFFPVFTCTRGSILPTRGLDSPARVDKHNDKLGRVQAPANVFSQCDGITFNRNTDSITLDSVNILPFYS